jgi:hypothetical protein
MDDRPAGSFDPGASLVDAVRAALPGWVRAQVARFDPLLASSEATDEAVTQALAQVVPALQTLVGLDVDQQRTNPLSVVRSASRFPSEVLADAGVRPPRRDPVDTEMFPLDVYGLVPARWLDLGDAVHEAGIVWGAWKAKTVLDRRRAEGLR